MRKPFFKKSHRCWYVKDRACREIRLDPDEEKAYEIWRAMLDAQAPLTPSASFPKLLSAYCDAVYENKRSYHETVRHARSFAEHVGHKKAADVTRRDIVTWLDAPKPGKQRKVNGLWVDGPSRFWSARSKQVALAAIRRVYAWSVDEGILAKSPVKGVRVTAPVPRCAVITPEEHARLVEAASPAFRLVLIAATCGARPQQIRQVTAADVLPDFSAWVMHSHKTAHSTGKPIVVHLHPCLSTLTRVLAARRRTGPLFLNNDGKPWKKDTIVRNMKRLRERLGISKDAVLYAYRHTFATNALMSDVPIQSVSALLGHTDTRMVSRVYGHLDLHRHHLAEVARQAFLHKYNQP